MAEKTTAGAAMMALAGVVWLFGMRYLDADTRAAPLGGVAGRARPGGFPVIPPGGG